MFYDFISQKNYIPDSVVISSDDVLFQEQWTQARVGWALTRWRLKCIYIYIYKTYIYYIGGVWSAQSPQSHQWNQRGQHGPPRQQQPGRQTSQDGAEWS